MNPSLLKPVYQSKPIASVGALARCLKIEEQELRRLSEEASSLYRVAKPIVKADGSIRRPFDAKPPLKRIQDRIKTEIFSNVLFPPYLTGSLKGHDYVTNAELHVNKKVVICEDIQNFFPSVSHELVYDVWLRCLNFSPDVAAILTSSRSRTAPCHRVQSRVPIWPILPFLGGSHGFTVSLRSEESPIQDLWMTSRFRLRTFFPSKN
jgi:hypothetical protein